MRKIGVRTAVGVLAVVCAGVGLWLGGSGSSVATPTDDTQPGYTSPTLEPGVEDQQRDQNSGGSGAGDSADSSTSTVLQLTYPIPATTAYDPSPRCSLAAEHSEIVTWVFAEPDTDFSEWTPRWTEIFAKLGVSTVEELLALGWQEAYARAHQADRELWGPLDSNGCSVAASLPQPPLEVRMNTAWLVGWVPPYWGAEDIAFMLELKFTSQRYLFATGELSFDATHLVDKHRGETLSIRVRSTTADGERSDWTEAPTTYSIPTTTTTTATTSTTIPSTAKPGRASGLTATESNGSVTLSWNAPTDGGPVTGYRIWRRLPDRGAKELSVLVNDTASTATSYTDTSAVQGQKHIYRVQALNGNKAGQKSLRAQITVS